MRNLTRFFLTALLVVVVGVSNTFAQASSSTAELRGQVTPGRVNVKLLFRPAHQFARRLLPAKTN